MTSDDHTPRPIHCEMPMIKVGIRDGKQRWQCSVCRRCTVNPGKPEAKSKAQIDREYLERLKADPARLERRRAMVNEAVKRFREKKGGES